jgi:hypothetical protein
MPTTAGHALYDLLQQLRRSNQVTVLNAWSSLLGAEAGSAQWAQRHAEVVGLYQSVIQQIMSLPEEDPTRKRALRYAPGWYRAVVWQSNWQSNGERPRAVVDDATLDHLGSIADIVAYRIPGAAVRPSDNSVARLRGELDDWLDLLGHSGEVPQATREEIGGQIRHVLWLLDNIETFGAAPVVREVRTVVGRATESAVTQGWASKLATRIGALVIALGAFTSGMEATTQALEAGRETLTVVSEIVRGEPGSDEQSGDRPGSSGGAEVQPAETAGEASP